MHLWNRACAFWARVLSLFTDEAPLRRADLSYSKCLSISADGYTRKGCTSVSCDRALVVRRWNHPGRAGPRLLNRNCAGALKEHSSHGGVSREHSLSPFADRNIPERIYLSWCSCVAHRWKHSSQGGVYLGFQPRVAPTDALNEHSSRGGVP